VVACGRVPATAHALRHTAASDVLRAGAHLRDVQAMLGRASLKGTARYLPLLVGDLRCAAEFIVVTDRTMHEDRQHREARYLRDLVEA
jgi:integrase